MAGATDAGEAARAGIHATTFLGTPFTNKEKDVVYHSPRDIPENVDPKAIEVIAKVFVHFVYDIDSEKFQLKNNW